jgi:huntingtin interacting protein 1
MSMHASKQAEFDSQVRVMELETMLQKERQRLGELRKRNYKDDSPAVGPARSGTPA